MITYNSRQGELQKFAFLADGVFLKQFSGLDPQPGFSAGEMSTTCVNMSLNRWNTKCPLLHYTHRLNLFTMLFRDFGDVVLVSAAASTSRERS